MDAFGALVVDNKKMSKSLGNFFTLLDLLSKGYTGVHVRYMLMHTHYKMQLNFTFEGLEAVKISLQRLQDFITRLQEIASNGFTATTNLKFDSLLNEKHSEFTGALADDLNISMALAVVFDRVRQVNGYADQGEIGNLEATKMLELFRRFDAVLGILNFDAPSTDIPSELQEALEKRLQVRNDKDWALADRLRDLIVERGYIIEDIPKGPLPK